jgi:hypothetical protein
MKRTEIFALLLGLMLTVGFIRADQVDVSQLTLVGIAEADGVTYASLYNAQNGEHFLTSSKDAYDGLELVSVASEESATIRQNGQTYLLRLSWPAATAQVADDGAQPVPTAQDIPLPGSVEATAPKPPEGAKLPLVFQVGNLAKLNLSDDQKAAMGRLRQQFTAAVGGGSAAAVIQASPAASEPSATAPETPATSSPVATTAVTSPPYQNWLTAQETSDAQFVMLFGQEAFNLSQMGSQSK